MSRVSVAVHPEAVSTRTDTEVVEDKGGNRSIEIIRSYRNCTRTNNESYR